MSLAARRAATTSLRRPFNPTRTLQRRTYAETTAEERSEILRKGAKKDPELYVYASPHPRTTTHPSLTTSTF